MSKDSEEKKYGVGVAIVSNARDIPLRETTWEGINDLLDDGYEVNDDRLSDLNNKPTPIGDNERPVYKEVWKCIGTDDKNQKSIDEIQRKFMRWTKNASVSWLTLKYFFSSCLKRFSMKSFWWIPVEELEALILTSMSSSGALVSRCWWQQTLSQIGQSILEKIL